MENFTPFSALAGGILVGLSAALLLWLNGRVAGISGIAGSLLSPKQGDIAWRLAFLAGLVLAPLVYWAAAPHAIPVEVNASTGLIVVGGLLVGFGTRMGSGCTSGHGVCGLARFSRRSLVATLSFMGAGFVTVFLVRHVFGG